MEKAERVATLALDARPSDDDMHRREVSGGTVHLYKSLGGGFEGARPAARVKEGRVGARVARALVQRAQRSVASEVGSAERGVLEMGVRAQVRLRGGVHERDGVPLEDVGGRGVLRGGGVAAAHAAA